jgi:hypothetical protein
MTRSSQSTRKLASIILIVAGAGLAIWGYQESGGLGSQLSNTFTGSPADNVMLLYIGGAVCFAAGIFLFTKK